VPEDAPPKLAELLTACFQQESTSRPTFKEILAILDEVEQDIKANPFY